MTEKKRKICTHCGAVLWNRRTGQPVKELYDEDLFMKSKILRLLDCKNCCGHPGVVDAYVEQEVKKFSFTLSSQRKACL